MMRRAIVRRRRTDGLLPPSSSTSCRVQARAKQGQRQAPARVPRTSRRGRDRSLRRQEHVLGLVVVIYIAEFVIRGRRRRRLSPVVLPTVVHVVAGACVRVRERG